MIVKDITLIAEELRKNCYTEDKITNGRNKFKM